MSEDGGRDKFSGGRLGRRRMLQLAGVSTLGTLVVDTAAGMEDEADEEDEEAEAESAHQVTVSGPSSVEVGSSYRFQASGYEGWGHYEYHWSSSGTISGDGKTVTVTFDSEGTHWVSVTVIDLEQAEILGSDRMDVSVEDEPTPVEVSLYGRDELVVRQVTEITASPDIDDVSIEYDWQVEGAHPNAYRFYGDGETVSIRFFNTGEFTLRVDYETEEGYESEVSMEIEVVDVQPYIDQKAGTISDVRSHVAAMPGISLPEAEARVDQKAEALLQDLEAGKFDVDPDQYEEALKRMNAAEEVTSATTEAVTGDYSVFRRIIDSIYDFTIGAAVELLLWQIPGSGALARLNSSIIRDISRNAGRITEMLSRSSGPSSQVGRIISNQKRIRADRIREWADNNPEQVDQAAVDIVGEGFLDMYTKYGESLLGELDSIEEGKEELAQIFFESYYFGPTGSMATGGSASQSANVGAAGSTATVPDPETWDLPTKEVTVEFPVEELPPEYWVLPIDKIIPVDELFEIDPRDFNLITPQAIKTLNRNIIQSSRDVLMQEPGINNQIDARMDDLREEIGSLYEAPDTVRDAVTSVYTEGIDAFESVTEQCLDIVDFIGNVFMGLSLAAAFSAVIAVIVAVATIKFPYDSVFWLVAGAKLGIAATALSVMSLFMELVEAGGGLAYLETQGDIHYLGTERLTKTNLDGVDL